MRFISSAALAVSAFLSLLPAAAEEDCRLTLAASLPVSIDNPHRVIIPAEIDGKPLRLMIDTGSGLTGLTAATAARLGIEPHLITAAVRINFPYAGGRVTHFVAAKNFKLSGMTSPQAQLVILPDAIRDADGLLGADFLNQFDVEFDFAGNKVNLFAPHPCADKVVYWTQTAPVAVIPFKSEQRDRHIRIAFTLDGHSVPAFLDTGAPNTSISLTTASTWFNVDESTPGVKNVGDGVYRYRFKTLSLDGVEVQNPDILIHGKASGGHTLDFQALLGMSILRQLHLYVAYKEHKLYVTSASAH